MLDSQIFVILVAFSEVGPLTVSTTFLFFRIIGVGKWDFPDRKVVIITDLLPS